MLPCLRYASVLLLLLGAAVCVYQARLSGVEPPAGGHAGRMRARARRRHVLFRCAEPWLVLCASAVRRWPLGRAREPITRMLARAGDYLGLSADELLGLAVTEALAAASSFALAAWTLDARPWLWASAGFGAGFAAPLLRVRRHAMLRTRQVQRGLPEAIDLLALCMSGGLDFSRSLDALLSEGSLRHAALQDELARVAEAGALGRTRAQALSAFSARTRAPAARDFVSAIVQAERTGTPLRTVLEIQARMLRMQRSTLAEEAAARAALLLLAPLSILLVTMLLLLFGPFVVGGIGL